MGLILGLAAAAAFAGSQPTVITTCRGPSEFSKVVNTSRIDPGNGGTWVQPSFHIEKTPITRAVQISLEGDRGQVNFGPGVAVDLKDVVWSEGSVTAEYRAVLSNLKVNLNRVTGEVDLDGDMIQFHGNCDPASSASQLGASPTRDRFAVSWDVQTSFVLTPANNSRLAITPEFGDTRVADMFNRTLSDGDIPAKPGDIYCDCLGYSYQRDGKSYYKITDARLLLVTRK